MKVWCAALAAALFAACGHRDYRKVIVIGVDGMDPGFVERHWADLPNLARLRNSGSFQRLATTDPPQSPVAWSTFITGLDPAGHGIFDFVHRDPQTHEIFLSTDRTIEPRWTIPLGPWRLPLSGSHVESLRKGKAFWRALSERGVPVTIVRMPANYPALPYGQELSGMGTPDLRGTQGTYSFFSSDGRDTHSIFILEGPPNTLRADRKPSTATIDVDVDPEAPVARVAIGEEAVVVREGEWSDWIPIEFPLIPHVASVRGMVRVYAKQLRPQVELYVSPVNIDSQDAALPISHPAAFARGFGRFYTLGIPEDTSALRQGVFTLEEFLSQTRLVLEDEQRLLRKSLDGYRDGFLFFYFSSVDQNSHMLWGRHDDKLLHYYRGVDQSIGEVMRRVPNADLIVMSDHGFSTFDRAVNLNAWLLAQGLLVKTSPWEASKAYAVGLNALYLNGSDPADIRERLLAMRDPENGRAPVERVVEVRASDANRAVAPSLVIGYAPGYRASWRTGLGEVPNEIFENNTDAWIADHCINSVDVPGVLFLSRGLTASQPSLRTLSRAILGLYSVQ